VSSLSARPGAAFGVYPERERVQPGWLQQSVERAALLVGTRLFSRQREFGRIIAAINEQGDQLSGKKGDELQSHIRNLRQQLSRQGATDALATASFALVREVVKRELGLRLFDEQMMGGWVMFKGELAEMAHGEGKTLANLLPACTAALAGIPVHLISVNDRLAKRDASLLRPIYQTLGLSVGLVETNTPIGERRAAYQCDVTYCSSRQVAFDYLQDRVLLRRESGILRMQVDRLKKQNSHADQLRLRGLCYAIVDDADSILIDESLSPLILSRSGGSAGGVENVEGDVLARTTFPRFFQRYIKLCGTAANLCDLTEELHTTYGLRVRSIVSRRASLRQIAPDRVFTDQTSKWQAICDSAVEKFSNGQPVLVFTRSQAQSEHLGELLSAAGVPHRLSDTNGNGDSCQALALAGARGAVTVSSTWPGHGTDIHLDPEARDLGGLHVILSERYQGARIDDRFIGHCARRGEPGSAIAMLSLEDDLAQEFLPPWMHACLQRSQLKGAGQALRLAQKKQQRLIAQARQQSLSADRQLDELLAFSGTAL
jgi:preprotein translocase subunit SecA